MSDKLQQSSRSTLPLLIGVLPMLVFHLTHLLSARAGLVPWCNPYWDSCTSISATGRDGLAFWLFKLTMLPAAALLFWYWQHAWQQLRHWSPSISAKPWLPWIGSIAAVFLALYTLALGFEGEGFRWQRRLGSVLFFSLTYLSQLLYTWQLGKLHPRLWTFPWHLALCLLTLAIGLLSLLLDWRLENYRDYEDAFEWVLALLLQLFFVLSYWSWRHLDQQHSGSGPEKLL